MFMNRNLSLLVVILMVISIIADDDRFILRVGKKKLNVLGNIVESHKNEAYSKGVKCKYDALMQKLDTWKRNVKNNTLFFDDPITNYVYIKVWRMDLPAVLTNVTMKKISPPPKEFLFL